MSSGTPSRYTPYHPKWYRRPVSVWWWLESWTYTRFVLRELTSVSVGYFALTTLWQVRELKQGPEAYAHSMARLKHPIFVALDMVVFIFTLFHSFSWFNLTPRAMVLRVGGRRVQASVIIGLNYLAWVLISAAVVWVLLRAGL